MPFTLRYQACDDKVCYAPSTARGEWTLAVREGGAGTPQHAEVFARIPFGTGEAPPAHVVSEAETPRPAPAGDAPGDAMALLDNFTVAGTTGGYIGSDDFLRFIRNAETGVKEKGLFEGRGPLAILLLVLLGGLALNLTPCVLPMIPINLAIIGAGAKAGSRRRGFLLGGVYGAAMALVYGVLGLIVILDGRHVRHHQRVAVVQPGIALALRRRSRSRCSMSSKSTSRDSPADVGPGSSHGSVALAFAMGGVAALLAGACVAPVVIQVVLFSSNLYATGTSAALALPFLLGVGMAVAVANRRRRPQRLAEAGRVDGPCEAGVRRDHSGNRGLLRIPAYGLFGDRWVDPRGVVERRDELLKDGWHATLAEGLAVAAARTEARADRHVGDVVQELPDDGQDDAGRSVGEGGARRLREDQVPGGVAGRVAAPRSDAALQRDWPADLRHPEIGREMRRDVHRKNAAILL